MKARARAVALSLAALFLLGVAGIAAAYWVLISPGNPLTRLFRRPIEVTGAKIVIGPYPLAEDFPALVDGGVTTIVSLLNPDIPYEGVLLERERELASRHGIRLESFPMSSILGQRFGADYDRNADRAAEAIRSAPGRVYLHCYLGLHRIETVRARLGSEDVGVARREGERSDAARRLDRAEEAYAAGRFEEARAAVAEIPAAERSRHATLLEAWSTYRLGRFEEARERFVAALREAPSDSGALAGLAFCDLQRGLADRAEQGFAAAVAADDSNADAHYGRALALRRLGRAAEAVTSAEAALRANPRYGDARGLLAELSPGAGSIP